MRKSRLSPIDIFAAVTIALCALYCSANAIDSERTVLTSELDRVNAFTLKSRDSLARSKPDQCDHGDTLGFPPEEKERAKCLLTKKIVDRLGPVLNINWDELDAKAAAEIKSVDCSKNEKSNMIKKNYTDQFFGLWTVWYIYGFCQNNQFVEDRSIRAHIDNFRPMRITQNPKGDITSIKVIHPTSIARQKIIRVISGSLNEGKGTAVTTPLKSPGLSPE